MITTINPTLQKNFVTYLITKKYTKNDIECSLNTKEIPLSYIKDIFTDSPTTIFLFSYSFPTKYDDMENFISMSVNFDFKSDEHKDLLFALLHTTPLFTNSIQTRFSLPEYEKTVSLYEKLKVENKEFIEKYSKLKSETFKNKKDQGNLDWEIKGSKVITRFPPEPSGYLHIGHVKAALLNYHFSHINNGTLRVRFDDTNPSKEKQEFEDVILEDLHRLGIKNYILSHSSDYFDQILEFAFLLINKNLAYCDDTDLETMRKQRDEGVKSRNRDMGVNTCTEIFKGIINGKNTEYCLRAKIDYLNLNKALRDPVIYRYSNVLHHRTGSKYNVYPTYDFTCPIVDSLEEVTHTLRTNEYKDRNSQYKWFLENLDLENKPEIFDFSRLNFENTVLSKRKLKFYVENGYVTGWDDPRMPTIRGILRLGLQVDVLKEYILMQGASQKTSTISWDKIWALNKKKIENIAPRFSCVEEKDFVICEIENTKNTTISVPRHRKNNFLGEKKVLFSSQIILSQFDATNLNELEEFTLMNIGNAIVTKKIQEKNLVKKLSLKLNPTGDYKQTKHKINWISKVGSVTVKSIEYGNLIGNMESQDLHTAFNHNSYKETYLLCENSITEVKKGDIFQFERFGFYYCDDNFIFHLVPFTKQKRNE
ncbi:glutamate--tRNA ligase [Hamiltosporidium tvaerminnensis]|uniref:glutamate--tRNA ligase n=3 Tax=Hamiltosporidium tvaerminnensis TaxID=1176355 RepID=A0A4Q9M166_9MICR|nr:glutamate--tRNA ligase [Hamiltosporidium tvaerminnensis]